MSFPLLPRTAQGERFVALAEMHAADFATRAAEHDRDGTFAHENYDAMKASGFTACCVPVEFGGGGMTSIHDLAVGISRLAKGDASTTIAIAMHLLGTWGRARAWRLAPAGAPKPGEEILRRAGAGEITFAAANSENGSDPRHPFTEATRTETGWIINGRKAFGTGSPAADYYSCNVMIRNDDGTKQLGIALLHRDTPGMRIDPVWDAFGMRGSGSDDIVFENCHVETNVITVGQKWGTFGVTAGAGSVGGVVLAAPFLGIAEAAHELAIGAAMTRKRRRETPMRELVQVQQAVAEIEVLLSVSRSALERSTDLADMMLTRDPAPTLQESQQLMMEVQAMKHFVNRTAIEICDKSLALSGGGGYMNRNPLGRFYRDVRAGPFMSPLTAGDGMEYIGRVALGLDPDET